MDKDNILIRKVRISDAREYILLLNSVWRSSYQDIFPEEVFIDLENRLEERIKKFPNKFFNDDKRMCYVAICNGVMVGLIYGIVQSEYDYFGENNFADLVSLYIKPEYQNMGLGRKLKEVFEEWARANGAKKYVIGVLKENKNARVIYEKWGGKLDSHEQEFRRLGIGYDEVFYTYDL